MSSAPSRLAVGASQLVCESSAVKGALLIGRKSFETPAWTRHWTTATAKLTEELYLSYGFRSLPSALSWLTRAGPHKMANSDTQKFFRKRLVRVIPPTTSLPQKLPPRIAHATKVALGSILLVRKDSLQQAETKYASLPVSAKARDGGKTTKARAEPKLSKALCSWITRSVIALDPDRGYVAISKPSGTSCQSGTGVRVSVDRCCAMLSAQVGGGRVPKLVHRLDKDSSGVLLLSTSDTFTRLVSRAFSQGDRMVEKIRSEAVAMAKGKDDYDNVNMHQLLEWYQTQTDLVKVYWTVVKLNKGSSNKHLSKVGLIDHSLRTDLPYRVKPLHKEKDEGKGDDVTANKYHQAMTFYRVLKRSKTRALLEVTPVTGKRHQIRAHLSYVLGYPIVGDSKYGGNSKGSKYYRKALVAEERKNRREKLHLHCKQMLCKLLTGKTVDVSAALPSHMEDTIESL